ncbi:MAG: PhnD/SsuA/transferrin family substrate-binding protein [Thiobacillus sp.]
MEQLRRAGQRANRYWAIVFALTGIVALTACDTPTADPPLIRYTSQSPTRPLPTYRLAVYPLHNAVTLSESYQPLIEYLNRQIPAARFELETARSYAAFEAGYRAHDPDLILANPLQSLQAFQSGYTPIAMVGDAQDFRGLFIVRRDSTVQRPTDLRGKTLACASRAALAGCLMPLWFLHQSGLDLSSEIVLQEVGSQTSTLLNVSLGEVAVGLTWSIPWRVFQRSEPAQAAKLKVLWETDYIMSNSVMLRRSLPAALQQQIRHALLNLHTSTAGQTVLMNLDIQRFHPASDTSYAPAQQFITRFEREVPSLLMAGK